MREELFRDGVPGPGRAQIGWRRTVGMWLHEITCRHDGYRQAVDVLAVLGLIALAAAEWQNVQVAAAGGALVLRLVAGGVALALGALAVRARFAAGNGLYFSLDVAAVLLIFFLMGPAWAAAGMALGNAWQHRDRRVAAFYGAQWVLAVGAATAVYALAGGHFGIHHLWDSPLAILAATGALFVANSALVYWELHHISEIPWHEIGSYFRGDCLIYGVSSLTVNGLTYSVLLATRQGWAALPLLAILALPMATVAALGYSNLRLRTRAEQFGAFTALTAKLIWNPPEMGQEPALPLALPTQIDPQVREQLTAILESLRTLNEFKRATIWMAEGPEGPLHRLAAYTVETGAAGLLIALGATLHRPTRAATTWPGLYATTIYAAWDHRQMTAGYAPPRGVTAISSTLAVPLVGGDRPLGILALESIRKYDERSAREQQTDLMAQQIALFLVRTTLDAEQQRLAVEAALQTRTRDEHARMAGELAAARRMQERFLPAGPPAVPGLALAALSRPAMEVGGDFYDYRVLPGDRLAVLVGDATGKGTGAVMQIAMVKTLLSEVWAGGAPAPHELVERLNAGLHSLLPGAGMTLFCAVIDPGAGTLTYANAGHVYPYVRLAGGLQALEGGGLPLGILPGAAYREATVTFAPGAQLILYSDGIVEALDAGGTLFSFERLEAVLAAPAGPPAALTAAVLAAVTAFAGETAQADDITLLVVERAPAGDPPDRATKDTKRHEDSRHPADAKPIREATVYAAAPHRA